MVEISGTPASSPTQGLPADRSLYFEIATLIRQGAVIQNVAGATQRSRSRAKWDPGSPPAGMTFLPINYSEQARWRGTIYGRAERTAMGL